MVFNYLDSLQLERDWLTQVARFVAVSEKFLRIFLKVSRDKVGICIAYTSD